APRRAPDRSRPTAASPSPTRPAARPPCRSPERRSHERRSQQSRFRANPGRGEPGAHARHERISVRAGRAPVPAPRETRAAPAVGGVPLDPGVLAMPLVRISLLQGPDGFGRKVGQVVYRTMLDTIDVPKNDNFQVITEHSKETLVFDRTYMGIARSDGFISIQITMTEGRSLEKKRLLYRTLVERLQGELNVRPEDVMINLVEVK